jgi:hypothetical protein
MFKAQVWATSKIINSTLSLINYKFNLNIEKTTSHHLIPCTTRMSKLTPQWCGCNKQTVQTIPLKIIWVLMEEIIYVRTSLLTSRALLETESHATILNFLWQPQLTPKDKNKCSSKFPVSEPISSLLNKSEAFHLVSPFTWLNSRKGLPVPTNSIWKSNLNSPETWPERLAQQLRHILKLQLKE